MRKHMMTSLISILAMLLIITGCGASEQTDIKTEDEGTNDTTSGASEQTYTNQSELKDSYDIVIVGAGGAGMAAAIQASDAGMNPVIFEKMPVAGGNTIKSSAGMNASETKFQKEQDIVDSNDKFFEETLNGGNRTNDQDLLHFFVDHSAPAIEWLDSMGIKLNNLTVTGGMSVERTHRPEDGSAIGGYLVDGLLRNVYEREIPIFVNAEVTAVNKIADEVNGVTVLFNGQDEKEIDSKAVIVTTGGFGANEELIEQYREDLKGYVSTNQEGTTGDGIKMIQKIGGATVDLEHIQIHPTVQQENSYLITEAVRGEGAILVTQDGQRFFNELETRDKVSNAIIDLPEQYAYLIFDAGVKERVKAINFYEEKGFVESGETIETLAEKTDLPMDTLEKTINSWNESVKNSEDTAFNRTTGMDHDLSSAPYYAIKIAPGVHHTMGGVKVNTNTQVLNKEDHAIPGLYAAGELTGGLHGENRIGGNAVADIIIFGRQAGEQAAQYAETLK
ncbi:Fumarate reductase flavoprotein subunit precursor [Paraliobacillus sp. PM-2]|uniref:flavocytochrome c n=1 Tax=Paraliobacillus sp. PM-2 TaxID=1462524 RepID=UPI00061C13BD|nr:flavocytochrome c [Paraliobacillus sp. PM-2]CQR45972.1 Fumarate reductase flavoprotein subunit precursor [Paraliobacillus sp. PM-2]